MSSFLVCQLRLLHSRYCSLKTQGNYLQARNGLGGAPWPPTHPFNLFLFPVISLLRSMWHPHHSQRGDFSPPLNICSLHSAAWLKLRFLAVLRFGPNESLLPPQAFAVSQTGLLYNGRVTGTNDFQVITPSVLDPLENFFSQWTESRFASMGQLIHSLVSSAWTIAMKRCPRVLGET